MLTTLGEGLFGSAARVGHGSAPLVEEIGAAA